MCEETFGMHVLYIVFVCKIIPSQSFNMFCCVKVLIDIFSVLLHFEFISVPMEVLAQFIAEVFCF